MTFGTKDYTRDLARELAQRGGSGLTQYYVCDKAIPAHVMCQIFEHLLEHGFLAEFKEESGNEGEYRYAIRLTPCTVVRR